MSEASFNELERSFAPCAEWTNDCQGKKDFDGRFLSISTRYWPAVPSSPNSFDTATGKWSAIAYGDQPHANAAIVINHGEPDQHGYGEYTTLVEKDFRAETEELVKLQVEEWVAAQCKRIVALLVASQ